MIDLKNDVDKKNPENENLNKTISIFEKFLTLIINKKSREIKILTPKQTFRGFPIALPQVKAGYTSKNLLNEICKIIYSLYQAK